MRGSESRLWRKLILRDEKEEWRGREEEEEEREEGGVGRGGQGRHFSNLNEREHVGKRERREAARCGGHLPFWICIWMVTCLHLWLPPHCLPSFQPSIKYFRWIPLYLFWYSFSFSSHLHSILVLFPLILSSGHWHPSTNPPRWRTLYAELFFICYRSSSCPTHYTTISQSCRHNVSSPLWIKWSPLHGKVPCGSDWTCQMSANRTPAPSAWRMDDVTEGSGCIAIFGGTRWRGWIFIFRHLLSSLSLISFGVLSCWRGLVWQRSQGRKWVRVWVSWGNEEIWIVSEIWLIAHLTGKRPPMIWMLLLLVLIDISRCSLSLNLFTLFQTFFRLESFSFVSHSLTLSRWWRGSRFIYRSSFTQKTLWSHD